MSGCPRRAVRTAASPASATCYPEKKSPTGSGGAAAESRPGRERASSSSSCRLGSWTGSPISCRHRGRTGIATTASLPQTISSGGPTLKFPTRLGEPLGWPRDSPARGPPADWGEVVQAPADRDVFQAAPDNPPAIDVCSLPGSPGRKMSAKVLAEVLLTDLLCSRRFEGSLGGRLGKSIPW